MQQTNMASAHQSAANAFAQLPSDHPNPWGLVKGPFAAAIASAARIGWYFESPTRLRTELGFTWDFTLDSPRDIRGDVDRAVISWRAANVLEHTAAYSLLLRPSVDTQPIRPQVPPIFRRQFRRARSM